jgi:cell division protein FtsI/penicillin-binding protein 2
MLRRRALSLLLTSAARLYSRPVGTLDGFLDPKQGCALLLDVRSGDILASNSNPLANTILVPPGSTLKPFVLSALLRSGKLRSDESFFCPERLVLAGHRMDCSHPRLATPMHIDTALAYSCNCFVAHVAERFAPGELARVLEISGSVTPQRSADLQMLQALGASGILVTPVEMAQAWRKLALLPPQPEILDGLEGAVEYGTAQLARVRWATLAGKTGSARDAQNFIAWFAGFVPSRAPQLVIAVMLSGHHGGSDAAPVASQILDAWHAGHL